MSTNPVTTVSEFNTKLERIRKLLVQSGLDALLLRQTNNFAWATCGASSYINRADPMGVASLLITLSNHYVITNNIEAARLAQEEGLDNQNWEFQVTPWYEQKDVISELTGGMKLGADTFLPNALDISSEIALLRSQLTSEEGGRFRELGMLCAQSMQDAVDGVRPGMTEYEIAGLLSQAVENRGAQAIVNLIATDERISSFRHPLPTSKKLQQYVMLILCGRKWGLICSVTRLIHFGKLPEEIRRRGQAVAEIDAVMIAATRPGNTLGDVFHKAQAMYATTGFPDEWQKHHQGGSAGYAPREVTATPLSTQPIVEGQAFAWNPSVAGAKSEDSILVGRQSNEILTEMTDWPAIDVQVGGQIIRRPAILEKY
ncbi:MAG: aminopeptidase P family protein [Chloroflexi bacterium]|nr:aminopeptidase P family protein [Chloroflexota bacterium]